MATKATKKRWKQLKVIRKQNRKEARIISKEERKIITLQNAHDKKLLTCEGDIEAAKSLCKQYIVKESLTDPQWRYVNALVYRSKPDVLVSRKVKNVSKYYVYLISSGDFIKIGYSNSPGSRLRELQVGNPRLLSMIGQSVFSDRVGAKSGEASLHKRYRAYKARGEWFDSSILEDVLDLIKQPAHRWYQAMDVPI